MPHRVVDEAKRSRSEERRVVVEFFSVIAEVRAHICVTSELYNHLQYGSAQKKLLTDALIMEEVDLPPRSVFVGYRYGQHAGSG